MRALKQIGTYLIWTVIAVGLGMGYMRMVLGPNNKGEDGSFHLLNLIHDFGVFHIGARIGGIIALLFILLDVLVLKKKLESNLKAISMRFGVLLLITVVVGGTHYILEKVIDII